MGSPKRTHTSCRSLLRIESAWQLLHSTCSRDGSTMGISPPPGLGNRQIIFVRHCSGVVSRTSICLTINARLAVATSGKALGSRVVRWSVPIPLLLRNQATARAKAPSGIGGRACSALAASARQAWSARFNRGSSALSRCQILSHSSARNCTEASGSNRFSPSRAILSQQGRRVEGFQALQVSVRRFLGSHDSLESPFPDFRIDPRDHGMLRSSFVTLPQAPCP